MAALVGFWILAGTSAVAAPVSAVDDQGRRLTLARPARRIVSLAPNVTEMLFAVGAGRSLVGVTQYCDYPPAAKAVRKIGGFSAPDLEAVAAAKPDLVVAAYGNSLEGIAAIRRLGLPVFVTNPQGVDGVLRNLQALGVLTGRTREATSSVTSLKARLNRLKRRIAGRPPSRTLIVIWPDPMTVVGGRSFMNDAIRRAGGVNVAGQIAEAYPKLDPERLIGLRPEVIFQPGSGSQATPPLSERPGVMETPAGRAKRIYPVSGDALQRAGPRLVAAIEEMARRLHP